MIRRSARILLEIVGIAIGGLLVIAGVAAWRVSEAPIEARFIRPYLEQAINDAGLGFQVEVAQARLGWHRFRPVLDLHVQGVRVLGQGGAPIAAFEDATVGISLRGLLLGRPVLTEIDVRRPEIAIIRDKADHFSMRVGADESADQTGGPDPVALLKNLLTPPNDADAVGRLRRVHIVDGRVVVDDQVLGIAWSAPDVDIDISRTAADTIARVDLLLALPQRTARLTGDIQRLKAGGHSKVSLKFSDFEAAAIAPLAKILTPLGAVAIPVTGEAHAELDEAGNLLNADGALTGADGRLILPDFYPEALKVQSIALNLHYAGAPRRLTLDRLAVDFGDAQAALSGTADLNGTTAAIDARAELTNVPLARFDALWPHGVGVGGRDWVTQHIASGVVKSGNAHLVASAKTDDPDWLKSATVDGGFEYAGLEVNYFPPLPPVKNITGHATFDSRRMDLTIDSGMLGDIAVSQGVLAITGFDQDDRAIDIGLSITGPLMTAMSVIDSQPLGFAHKLGLDPKSIGGQIVDERLTFAFPLVKTLLSSQIDFTAKGKLDGVAVAQAIGSRGITDGALMLAIDKKGMTLDGDVRLSGVPLSIDWRESFLDSDRVRTRIAFHGDVDKAGWAMLDLDPSDLAILEGKVGVSGQVSIDRAKTTTLDVSADLAMADLTIVPLGLRKPSGEAGTATASLSFAGGNLRRVSRLQIDSPTAKLTGTANFAADGSFQHAELPKVTSHGSDYTLVADAEPGGDRAYAITVKGRSFDASSLLQQNTTGQPSSPHPPRLDLTLAVDRVLTSADRGIDAVTGTLILTGGRLDSADLRARAGTGPLTLTYQPAGDAIALHLEAQDAGAALAGLHVTGGVRGGTLKVDGTTKGPDNARLTTGSLDMRDFRLVKAPIIARLVNALSLTGFVDLLSGQGLGFDRLSSEVDYAGGKLTFRNGRSAGALGISFEGNVDFDADKIALKGTVVPVDTLNRIIAAIPVIGDIVTGGNRGGLIGWTYSVSGTPDDPRVSVNPLSMFAPGFLRNLFFLGPSEPAPKAEAPPPAAPQPPPTAPVDPKP